MFSVYEEHTRWIGKGKPGIIAELGCRCVSWKMSTHSYSST